MTLNSQVFSPLLLPTAKAHLPKSAYDVLTRPFLDDINRRVEVYGDYYADLAGVNDGLVRALTIGDVDSKASRTILYLITGWAGSGKTSFLRHHFENKPDKAARSHIVDCMSMNRVGDFGPKTAQSIACQLDAEFKRFRPTKSDEYENIFRALTNETHVRKSATTLEPDKFLEGLRNQSKAFCEIYTNVDGYMHLAIVVATISKIEDKPIWIVFDNLDQLNAETRHRLVDYSDELLRNIDTRVQQARWNAKLRVIVVVRPETATFHKQDYSQSIVPLTFPTPQLISIARRRLTAAINTTCDVWDSESGKNRLKSHIVINGHTYLSWRAFGDRLVDAVESGIDRAVAGINANDQMHAELVAYNVRRFVGHWPRIVLSNVAVDEWIAPPESAEDFYKGLRPHTYFRTLFRAGAVNYQGSQYFNAGADRSGGPIVVNLFDLGILDGVSHEQRIRNHLAPLRTLQYFHNKEHPVKGDLALADLELFFDRTVVIDALKFLIWARLLDETNHGVRAPYPHDTQDAAASGLRTDWRTLEILENLPKLLIGSGVGASLYLENFLHQYEYVSAMSPLTPTLVAPSGANPRRQPTNLSLVDSVHSVERLISTMTRVARENIVTYESERKLHLFKSHWYSTERTRRPISGACANSVAAISGLADRQKNVRHIGSGPTISQTLASVAQNIQHVRVDFESFLSSRLGTEP